MKLYVCYGTWTATAPVRRHPCGEANKALIEAGHSPQVVRTYGLGLLPDAVNRLSPGRREVQELTGNSWVPVLVLDDGTVIQGSQEIIGWARTSTGEGSAGEGEAVRAAPADEPSSAT
jgi:glutathione S-transferase-like protein